MLNQSINGLIDLLIDFYQRKIVISASISMCTNYPVKSEPISFTQCVQ